MRFVVALLAVCGLVVSVLALQVHYSTATAPCSINEKWDCGIVNHSKFAEVGGIPVATIGIGGFLALLWLALVRQRLLLFSAALVGFAFSLYLAYIEKAVLGVWCLYCVISLAAIALITVLSATWMVAGRVNRNV